MRDRVRAASKRIVRDQGYLESLSRPNLHLTFDNITHVEPDGVVTETEEQVDLNVINIRYRFHYRRLSFERMWDKGHGERIQRCAWWADSVSVPWYHRPWFPEFLHDPRSKHDHWSHIRHLLRRVSGPTHPPASRTRALRSTYERSSHRCSNGQVQRNATGAA